LFSGNIIFLLYDFNIKYFGTKIAKLNRSYNKKDAYINFNYSNNWPDYPDIILECNNKKLVSGLD